MWVESDIKPRNDNPLSCQFWINFGGKTMRKRSSVTDNFQIPSHHPRLQIVQKWSGFWNIINPKHNLFAIQTISAVSGSSSWNAKIDSLDGIVMCKLQSGEVQRIENHVWTHQMHYTCVTYSVSATFSCFRSIFTTYSNIPVRRWASKQEITVVCNLHEKWIFKR